MTVQKTLLILLGIVALVALTAGLIAVLGQPSAPGYVVTHHAQRTIYVTGSEWTIVIPSVATPIAAVVGVWLGARFERRNLGAGWLRSERRSAYAAYIHALVDFRAQLEAFVDVTLAVPASSEESVLRAWADLTAAAAMVSIVGPSSFDILAGNCTGLARTFANRAGHMRDAVSAASPADMRTPSSEVQEYARAMGELSAQRSQLVAAAQLVLRLPA